MTSRGTFFEGDCETHTYMRVMWDLVSSISHLVSKETEGSLTLCSLIQLGSELSLPPRREDVIAAAYSSQPFRSSLSSILPRAAKDRTLPFFAGTGKIVISTQKFRGQRSFGKVSCRRGCQRQRCEGASERCRSRGVVAR